MSMFRSYKDLERTPNKTIKQKKPVLYKCDICDEGEWMSETEVEIHRKSTHSYELGDIISNKKKHGCLVCARRHKDRESLLDHVRTEHLLSSVNAQRVEREIFVCQYCTRIFFNKMILAIHMAQKHCSRLSKNILVECPKCFKLLKKTTMWNHLEYHYVSSVSTCPICLEKCSNRIELKKHLESHRKYMFCDTCHFSTKYQDKFHDHLALHKRENTNAELKYQKYFVPSINMVKRARLGVNSPMKGVLLPRSMRVCVICRHICVSVNEMRQHLMFDHSPEETTKKKSYNCAVCDLEFSNYILLKQHMFKESHRLLEDQVLIQAEVAETVEEVVLDNESDWEVIP